MKSILISADDIKKELTGYSPEHSEEFHRESSLIADKRFYEIVKSSAFDKVILMSGGPASGKTEFVSEYLMDESCIVLDGVLPTEAGARIKIDRCKKLGKVPAIYAVWPKAFTDVYNAFLSRDRKFSDHYFFEKHVSARQALLYVAQRYSDVEIHIVQSSYEQQQLRFSKLEFANLNDQIAYLEQNQYSIDQIMELIIK